MSALVRIVYHLPNFEASRKWHRPTHFAIFPRRARVVVLMRTALMVQTQRRHRAAEGVDVAEQVQVPALRDRCLLLPVEIGATRTEPRVRLEI